MIVISFGFCASEFYCMLTICRKRVNLRFCNNWNMQSDFGKQH